MEEKKWRKANTLIDTDVLKHCMYETLLLTICEKTRKTKRQKAQPCEILVMKYFSALMYIKF